MLSSKAVNNRIDGTQKRVFWVNKDKNLSFDMYLKRGRHNNSYQKSSKTNVRGIETLNSLQ